MLKKIVIAADSFKGSLSSSDVAHVAATAIKGCLPECTTVEVTLGDGGEGTLDALATAMDAQVIEVEVADALLRPVTARYATKGSSAIIEMAQAAGLTMLADAERNPMYTTTFGVGQLIADALARGCRKIYVGIGGSATNDGGMGMLTALGFRFYDKQGRLIDSPGRGCDMAMVGTIDGSNAMPELAETEFIVACDVDNPFIGHNGAAYVFAPQKGADAEMCRQLDDAMTFYAEAIYKFSGVDVRAMKGAGAAGGLGGCFAAILRAKLMSGIDMVLDAVDLKAKLRGADLVITGEGRLDAQTAMGKCPSGVLKLAKSMGIPAVAIGGSVDYCPELTGAGFAAVISIQNEPCTLAEAMKPERTAKNLDCCVRQIVNLISSYSPDRCD